ncbi:MAG: T9SS type A sorting domain-containing protein [Saprospiraceae bacterium]|nr:T9SS type A sorting domain-containing protein [Saprospiraceae bacterium]
MSLTDADGATFYSNVQKVRIQRKSQISFYPNPFQNELFVKGLDESIESKIVITDMLGRVVFGSNQTAGISMLDVSGMERGMYILQILDNMDQLLHQQLILK